MLHGTSQCPPDVRPFFDALVLISWGIVALLALELGLLAVAFVRTRAGRLDARQRLARALTLTLLVACVALAAGLTLWLVRQNTPWCPWYNLGMYSPERAAMYEREYDGIVATAHATLAAILAVGALGTLATLLAVRRRPATGRRQQA